MLHRALLGWLLVGGFCAAVSCGGGNGSDAPLGFGAACKSEADCDAYDLRCGLDGKCVECLTSSDCESGETCTGSLCKPTQECEASGDCSGSQVCDDDSGECVDCVTSSDCKSGQGCSDHVCFDRQVCDFTSDCDDGLVCDIQAGVCVVCRTDKDCGLHLVCEDNDCVRETVSGSGGKGGGGAGGKSGSGGGGVSSSGSSNGGRGGTSGGGGISGAGTSGSGGISGSSGNGGTLSEAGAGGMLGEAGMAATDCECLITQACTPDERCVLKGVVDDLFDCDDQILQIEGRSGPWAADADIGIELDSGISDPGPTWTDRTCAVWASGTEATLNDPDATFAFVGFLLNDGAAYPLGNYTGIQIKLEAPSTSVQVVLKTTGGGYFQVTLAPLSGGSYLRTASFASMVKMANSAENLLNLSQVYEIQLSPTMPKSFRFAVHSVALY
jgi:hypothetical protein